MSELTHTIKIGLDENRMIVLVVQVLLGFECTAPFKPGFERLGGVAQGMKVGSFFLLIVTLALLLAVPAYHRIVERGIDTPGFKRVSDSYMELALFPFAIALGIDLAIASNQLLGWGVGLVLGIITTSLAAFFWYVMGARERLRKESRERSNMEKQRATPLKDKIEQVLTEARIVLPGTQALLGFQLSTFLTDAFEKLPRSSQLLHLTALGCIALSAIFLMTPAAYHRLAEHGQDSERFHKLASIFVLAAIIPLALGISLDFYIVMQKVSSAPILSATLAAVTLVIFYGFWFAYPLLCARARAAKG